MTFEQFSQIFAMLAIQLRAQDADEATARGYFDALKDLEPELVAMAAQSLAKSGEWFPKTSEWRDAVSQIHTRRLEHQKALMRKSREPWCLACGDTGWERTVRAETTTVKPCACAELRRLEVLGRRPWPRLIAGNVEPVDPEALEKVRAMVRPIVETKTL